MIENKPLKLINRITAYIISIICISTGSIGLFLSIYNYESIIIPVIATGFIIIGIIYGITAFKGKPVNFSKLKRNTKEM